MFTQPKNVILLALQAFSDNSNLDLIIRFVHHKCRSEHCGNGRN